MAPSTKDIRIKGLGGMLDTRSQPDEVGLQNYRLILNASTRARNRRCRRGGWRKLYHGVNDVYNNEDLHDQLLGLSFYYDSLSQVVVVPPPDLYHEELIYTINYCGTTPNYIPSCDEQPEFISSIGDSGGTRTLIAATKSRIYALTQSTGNWRIVADGLGYENRPSDDCATCTPERWMGARLENNIILVNGVDRVLGYNTLAQPTGCEMWRAEEIQDLVDLNVMSASTVGEWKTFIFIADVWQDGARRRNRIMWSNAGDPSVWIPDDDNLCGYQDLGNDETILRIEPLNDYLFIYTDRSIYRAALVASGTGQTFYFEEIYRGDLSLKYKYAFANTGEAHYFWSNNRLLKMTSFDKRPAEPFIPRLSSNMVFEGLESSEYVFGPLNADRCDQFVGGFNPQHNEIWFSWPTDSNSCPNVSMVINVTPGEEGVDIVDHGFTAFHWFDGRRTSTLMEYLEDLQVCPREDLLEDFSKEGGPFVLLSPPFENPVTCVWNAEEDITQPASDTSLCVAVQSLFIRDLCTECNPLSRFVMACAVDSTLKEYVDDIYYRERLEDGTYVLDGYATVLESGVDDLGVRDEKVVTRFGVTFTAMAQSQPNGLYGYIGHGAQPGCIEWDLLRLYDDCSTLVDSIPLSCISEYSAQERANLGIRRDQDPFWPCHIRDRFIGWKIKVTGTGGGSCFSRAALGVSKIGDG